MDQESERMQILERIERGELSVEEGLRLIETLPPEEEIGSTPATLQEGAIQAYETGKNELEMNPLTEEKAIPDPLRPAVEPVVKPSEAPADIRSGGIPLDAEKWRRFWVVPLWIGIGFTALGGILMSLALQSTWAGFWLVCATLPLVLGLLFIVLAGHARVSPWIHLRVQQKSGASPQRIAFSFPLPVRPAAWFLRNFGEFIPGVKGTSLDEVLLSVDEITSAQNPIYIQVDEGEEGEKVEIFIG